MEDGVEYSGRTVEDALTQAERQTGATRSELEYEVITAGRAGVFGIGSEAARIRVRQRIAAEVPSYAPSEETRADANATRMQELNTPSAESTEHEALWSTADSDDDEANSRTDRAPRPTESAAELAEAGATVLRELLASMGFDAEVTIRSEHDPIMLVITGENLGVLIGRRGDNLSALQFMVNLLLSKNRRQWPRIVIDAENYRARREESLRALSDRIAYRVRRNGRPFTLEAMPASDRRIIHLTLREDEEVETYSIGEGVSRRVVIAPKPGERILTPDEQ